MCDLVVGSYHSYHYMLVSVHYCVYNKQCGPSYLLVCVLCLMVGYKCLANVKRQQTTWPSPTWGSTWGHWGFMGMLYICMYLPPNHSLAHGSPTHPSHFAARSRGLNVNTHFAYVMLCNVILCSMSCKVTSTFMYCYLSNVV